MSKKKDLINKINEIVNEMANVLSNPNSTLIGKEYFRTNSMVQIEELINEYTGEDKVIDKPTPTFPVRKKKKK